MRKWLFFMMGALPIALNRTTTLLLSFFLYASSAVKACAGYVAWAFVEAEGVLIEGDMRPAAAEGMFGAVEPAGVLAPARPELGAGEESPTAACTSTGTG